MSEAESTLQQPAIARSGLKIIHVPAGDRFCARLCEKRIVIGTIV